MRWRGLGHDDAMDQMRKRAAAIGLVAIVWLAGCSPDSDSTSATVAPSIPALFSDQALPPNEPHRWELFVHCGAAFFSSKINDTWWRTAEGVGASWMPPEWGPVNGRTSGVPVVLELNTAGDQLTATYAGRAVVYTPTQRTEADLCD